MKLVQTLKQEYDPKRLEYRMKTYSRFKLMIVDEIGVHSIDKGKIKPLVPVCLLKI